MALRNAQISSTVFVYILAALVIVIVFISGYYLTGDISDHSVSTSITRFKSSLSNDVATLKPNYDSLTKQSYILPEGFENICFIDPSRVRRVDLIDYPLLSSRHEDGLSENVVLIGKERVSTINIPDLELSYYPYFSCVPGSLDSIELTLRGMGDSVWLVTPASDIWCSNADSLGFCGALDTFFGPGHYDMCCDMYAICCEVSP